MLHKIGRLSSDDFLMKLGLFFVQFKLKKRFRFFSNIFFHEQNFEKLAMMDFLYCYLEPDIKIKFKMKKIVGGDSFLVFWGGLIQGFCVGVDWI
jgi:hypothetical protein